MFDCFKYGLWIGAIIGILWLWSEHYEFNAYRRLDNDNKDGDKALCVMCHQFKVCIDTIDGKMCRDCIDDCIMRSG